MCLGEEAAHDLQVLGEVITADAVARPRDVRHAEVGDQFLQCGGVALRDDRTVRRIARNQQHWAANAPQRGRMTSRKK